MPPKKKRKVHVEVKPGIGRQFINDNYKDNCDNQGIIKNGRVLFFYFECEKSVMRTIDKLKTVSNVTCTAYQVVSLVKKTLDHYRHLTNLNELQKFKAICDETFICLSSTTNSNTISTPFNSDKGHQCDPSVSAERIHVTQLSSEQSTPSKSGPSVASSTRIRMTLTPRKVKLQRRLDFATESAVKMKSKLVQLKRKMKVPKRVVNQAIQRKINIIAKKDKQIVELKSKLKTNVLTDELQRATLELNQLKTAHRKLMDYHKKKQEGPEGPGSLT